MRMAKLIIRQMLLVVPTAGIVLGLGLQIFVGKLISV